MGHNIMSFQTSASGGGGAWEELLNQEFTNSAGSTTSSFEVKKFLRIQIIGYDYTPGAGADGDNPNMMITYNDEVYTDSNAAYSTERWEPASDARTSQSSISLFSAGGTDVATNSEMFVSMDISNLDSEVHLSTWQFALLNGTAASDDVILNCGAAAWEDTTNITKVRFQLTADRGTMDMHIVVLGHD